LTLWVSRIYGDQMTRQEADRQIKLLAVLQHAEEVTANVAMTCRCYGITPRVSYIWKRRYEELGPEGLKDRSRRPKVSPRATQVEVVGKILYLRQHYHFGLAKIAMYLKRYHDVSISHSGVWRILGRLELNKLPASQPYKRLDKRWKRYEKQLPGHQVQIDVKFIEPIKGAPRKKYYQFTAIDDCTCLRVVPAAIVYLLNARWRRRAVPHGAARSQLATSRSGRLVPVSPQSA
jgi:transposase